jgi:hypothetical protein
MYEEKSGIPACKATKWKLEEQPHFNIWNKGTIGTMLYIKAAITRYIPRLLIICF